MSSSQADLGDYGDYSPLVARFKELTRRDENPGPWLGDLPELGPVGPLPDIGPFDRRVIAVGGVVFAVLMALSARYGFDVDELYFLDCARHLQASYVISRCSRRCWRGCP